MLLGAVSFSSMPWMTLAGMLLYLLLNRPKKAKKPLVYTARVKRLLCCAGILAALWLLLLNYASTCLLYAALVRQSAALARWSLLLPVLAVVLTILWEHRLVLLCNDLMSPIEHAISHHYYKDAQRILESMPELTVIGITGSYGKTSTKYFLERLLSLRYNVYMTPGNYNTPPTRSSSARWAPAMWAISRGSASWSIRPWASSPPSAPSIWIPSAP